MLLTNHVLSGALIGAVVRRPVPAFLLGVASHFVLDAIPHWGNWRDKRQFLQVAVSDGLTGLAVMTAFAAAAPSGRRAAVTAGMVGAALPDIDKPTLAVVRGLALPGGGRPFSRPHSGRGAGPVRAGGLLRRAVRRVRAAPAAATTDR